MKLIATRLWAAVLPSLAACALVSAGGLGAGAVADRSSPADDTLTHSLLSPNRLLWPGVVVIVVLAIFVTAALTGPLIRANTDDDESDSEPEIRNRSDSIS